MLFIAVCSLGTVRIEWAMALATMKPLFGRGSDIGVVMGQATPDARNLAVALALAKEADYLLFWDDDMIPHTDEALRNLASALDRIPELATIGGVYPARRSSRDPVVCKDEGGGPFWDWRDGQIHEVYMAGTGFMLVRLSALPEVPTYQFGEVELPRYFARDERTDDFYFADLCKQHGLKQAVHGSVVCEQMQKNGERFLIQEAPKLVVATA